MPVPQSAQRIERKLAAHQAEEPAEAPAHAGRVRGHIHHERRTDREHPRALRSWMRPGISSSNRSGNRRLIQDTVVFARHDAIRAIYVPNSPGPLPYCVFRPLRCVAQRAIRAGDSLEVRPKPMSPAYGTRFHRQAAPMEPCTAPLSNEPHSFTYRLPLPSGEYDWSRSSGAFREVPPGFGVELSSDNRGAAAIRRFVACMRPGR